MELGTTQSQLADILHIVSQGLLIPVILMLLGFIGYALFCIGSIVSEAVKERRDFKLEAPKFLRALMEAEQDQIPTVIKESGLLNRQKKALLTVYDYRALPGDALVALIRRLVNAEETHYKNIVDRNNTAAKISPMVGLMGTLIPLGPGVAALGQGDTATLSSSLLIAFDTTVAGLIVAAICLAIGKIRSNWYDDYLSALDSAMATMLQKIEQLREAGEIKETEPSDYAFLFEEGLKEAAAKSAATPGEGKDAVEGGTPGGETAASETAAASAPAAVGAIPAAGEATSAGATIAAGTPASTGATISGVAATSAASTTAASTSTYAPAPLPRAAAPDTTARISSIPTQPRPASPQHAAPESANLQPGVPKPASEEASHE